MRKAAAAAAAMTDAAMPNNPHPLPLLRFPFFLGLALGNLRGAEGLSPLKRPISWQFHSDMSAS